MWNTPKTAFHQTLFLNLTAVVVIDFEILSDFPADHIFPLFQESVIASYSFSKQWSVPMVSFFSGKIFTKYKTKPIRTGVMIGSK